MYTQANNSDETTANAEKASDNEIEFFGFFGPFFYFSLDAAIKIALNKRTILYLLGVYVVIYGAYGFYEADPVTFVIRAFSGLISILAYPAVFIFYAKLWQVLRRGRGPVRLFRPLMSLLLLTTVAVIEISIPTALGIYDPTILEVARSILIYYVVIQPIELLFYLIILPEISGHSNLLRFPHETPASQKDPVTNGSNWITLNQQKIDLATIIAAHSQEHYLELITETGTILVRARLGDLAAQTSETDGIQTHRSWWVSARFVDRMSRAERGDVLIMTTGQQIPVARGRREKTRSWLDRT